jgi:dihydrofolate synthase/folylpolyglutamate synthase
MDDKDARGIVRALVPVASKMIVTQAKYKRALQSGDLAGIVGDEFRGPAETLSDSTEAFERGFDDILGEGLCVIGSLYVVGEAIQWWKERSAGNRGPQKV